MGLVDVHKQVGLDVAGVCHDRFRVPKGQLADTSQYEVLDDFRQDAARAQEQDVRLLESM